MADKTKIEWTDSTWNPVTGCTRVSPGCTNCYIDWAPPFRINDRHFRDAAGERSHAIGSTTGVLLHPERLDQPLRWSPRRIFVNSLSDLFHDAVSDEYIARVFAVMALAPQHTFQLLTKRHGRMRSLLSSDRFRAMLAEEIHLRDEFSDLDYDIRYPLINVWVGVTVEDQERADLRIPALLATPAAVRFLSVEPMLGPVDIGRWILASGEGENAYPSTLIDWVICGGESGPNARPMHPEWARTLRDQCHDIIPFLFEQWGEWVPAPWHGADGATHAFPGTAYVDHGTLVHTFIDLDHSPTSLERDMETPPGAQGMRRVGKKAAGRELDGRTWDEYPGGAS